MKKILLIALTTFLSLNTVLALEEPLKNILSAEEQLEIINDIAKNIRQTLWSKGYEDVTSSVTFVKKEFLDNYVSDSDYETNLSPDEISKLYKCYYGKTCELYYIGVSSEYYGGSGYEGYFILFYPKSKKYFKISHVVYAE